jgi:alkanesulfonate monooxygenase SsuD/methylene tetrahydromethanopterin reductase-like flavin-dependent oxidoreductase (luciferase family)
VHVGLALPQFDRSGSTPLPWVAVRAQARQAEDLGFESLWVAEGAYDPLVSLGALARATGRVGLGTLVLEASLRPAAVVAKALATVDVVSGGRLVVGLGAGPAGAGPGLLAEACQVMVGMFGGGPFSFAGDHYRVAGARCLPLPVQRPHPPIWLAGDDGVVEVVARHAQGWITGWAATTHDYQARTLLLERACAPLGRDPTAVTRALGLTSLVGQDRGDLEGRFRDMTETAPTASTMPSVLDEWRSGRLVGTVEEVRAQVAEWDDLGVDTLVVAPGPAPLSRWWADDVEMLAAACSLKAV